MINGILAIIVVTYNSKNVISRLLHSLTRGIDVPIVVVDNHSRDGTVAAVRQQFPAVKVIECQQNMGYGRAANVVLRSLDTRYALLLNPDVDVPQEALCKLVDYALADDGGTAVWGPAMRLEHASGSQPRSVNWVCGAAMLLDVEKIRQVGLFDENIFLFFEETDLCERVLKAGYRIMFCPDVLFLHHGGGSSEQNPDVEYARWWHYGWSECYWLTKHRRWTLRTHPVAKWIKYRLKSVTKLGSKRIKWKGRGDGVAAFLRGERAFGENGEPRML